MFPITHQRNFAMGFVSRILSRLDEMKANQEKEGGIRSGKELVFVGRENAVDEAFAEIIGKTRAVKRRGESKFDVHAYNAGRKSGDKANLGASAVGGNRKELV